MRLIDADKLESTAVLALKLQHANSRYYYFYEDEEIEKAPTIEAIPIKWIAKKAIDTDEQGAFATAYCMLIEEWRKENEDD